MFNKIKVFAIIPAKGNSQRLKNKNLRKIKDKTLLEITINSAKKSKFIDKIFISTESKKISKIVKKLNCEIIKRPKNLSKENTPANKVIDHSIEYLTKKEKTKLFLIILLQVTAPLRTTKDINTSFELLKKRKSKALLSVKRISSDYLKSIMIFNKKVRPINKESYLTANDQFLPSLYKPNGAIYIFTSKDFIVKKSIPFKKMIPFVMTPKKSIDINVLNDLKFARKLYK